MKHFGGQINCFFFFKDIIYTNRDDNGLSRTEIKNTKNLFNFNTT